MNDEIIIAELQNTGFAQKLLVFVKTGVINYSVIADYALKRQPHNSFKVIL